MAEDHKLSIAVFAKTIVRQKSLPAVKPKVQILVCRPPTSSLLCCVQFWIRQVNSGVSNDAIENILRRFLARI
jgi:hypothetical protein